jgi:hypothetical protein
MTSRISKRWPSAILLLCFSLSVEIALARPGHRQSVPPTIDGDPGEFPELPYPGPVPLAVLVAGPGSVGAAVIGPDDRLLPGHRLGDERHVRARHG